MCKESQLSSLCLPSYTRYTQCAMWGCGCRQRQEPLGAGQTYLLQSSSVNYMWGSNGPARSFNNTIPSPPGKFYYFISLQVFDDISSWQIPCLCFPSIPIIIQLRQLQLQFIVSDKNPKCFKYSRSITDICCLVWPLSWNNRYKHLHKYWIQMDLIRFKLKSRMNVLFMFY